MTDLRSQGGAIHLLARSSILDGQNSWASIVDRKSWKLKRITTSSLAGEVQAFSEAQDRQEWPRSFWLEIFSYSGLNVKHVGESLLADSTSTLVTDCKSLFDALANVESSGFQLTEQRSAPECHGCKQRLTQTNAEVRWVNSDSLLTASPRMMSKHVKPSRSSSAKVTGKSFSTPTSFLPKGNVSRWFRRSSVNARRTNNGPKSHSRPRMCTQAPRKLIIQFWPFVNIHVRFKTMIHFRLFFLP